MDRIRIACYCYTLGSDLLVCPVVDAAPAGTRVRTPPGEDDEWVYWFDDSMVLPGGTGGAGKRDDVTMQVPIDEYPIFRRRGAIVPLALRAGVQLDEVRPGPGGWDGSSELRLLLDWPRCAGGQRVCSGGMSDPVPALDGVAPEGLAASWTLHEDDAALVLRVSPTSNRRVAVEIAGTRGVRPCGARLAGGGRVDVDDGEDTALLLRFPGGAAEGLEVEVVCGAEPRGGDRTVL